MSEEILIDLSAPATPSKPRAIRGVPTERAFSSLYGSDTEHDGSESGEQGFFNPADPATGIKHEKAEHVLVVMLKAQGMSNADIAKRTGYGQAWVSQVLRQPWARTRLLREIRETGRDAIQTLLASTAEDSVFTLIEVRDNVDAKPADRASAANSLLDRFLGKPTQRVESQNTNINMGVADVAALDREIQELEREEVRLTGKTSTNGGGGPKP